MGLPYLLPETVDQLKYIRSFNGMSLLCPPTVEDSVVEKRVWGTQLFYDLHDGSTPDLYRMYRVTLDFMGRTTCKRLRFFLMH